MKQYAGFLNTPTLWTGTQFSLTQFEIPRIDLSTFSATTIPPHLRLGHQVEYIFKQLLDHSERYTVLAHNIQIKRDKITLGELDFVVEDRFRESVKIHIELTYKFYIIDTTVASPIHQLMGPNRKDHFYLKVQKTRDRQLPLAYSAEGLDALQSINVNPEQLEQCTLFMGQLFTPYNKNVILPEEINPRAIIGYWMQLDDFCTASFLDYRYYITTKPEWLHEPYNEVNWLNHKEALAIIREKHTLKRAPLVWIQKDDATVDKAFVVWW
ncbi:hypothetical protein MED134_04449 [Dokdonia sp. MED134]|uniref:DUF1853 family protein n=1 Tax=Dokdonia sp. MED134 TaxID=313590 RepID=UPI000068AC92|nr:DUF1853 family protein [Dokdonia sp. MED134]EAQ39973.1 hypothetical protein MED134_04449 [Dokdonia sp. MED134]